MADFLFVVDDSGSMSDNQNALAKAAEQFTAEMNTSGIAYRSAIITTGSGADSNGSAISILNRVGIIENNDTLLKKELVAGTNGSPIETGIWNAEQVLKEANATAGTPAGAVTALGMPKKGASLSVIIISDEDSQYTSRSGAVDFNVSDNLFIDRSIRVYSIVSADYNYYGTGFDDDNSSQYDDLSIATGGIFSDIDNKDANATLDYSAIMKTIATDAGGTTSSFVLAHPAAVINKVTIDGTEVLPDTQNGYTYIQSSKAIVFHGTALPSNGAVIVVEYEYYY
jgi:hypothetical protein